MSISFSPYLFGHKPREEGHLSKTDAAKKLVTEEPEYLPAEEYVEESIQETPVPVEQTPKAPVNQSVPAPEKPAVTAPTAPATPIVETDDEILE